MISDWKAGSVFLLNYDQFGHQTPEMVKERMVVIVNSRALRRTKDLVTVVPLSTTPPQRTATRHCVPLEKPYYWGPRDGAPLWAKCDMVGTVSVGRLKLLASARAPFGQNSLPVPQVGKEDLKRIRIGVVSAIDVETLLQADVRREFGDYLKRFGASVGRLLGGKGRRNRPTAKQQDIVSGTRPPGN